MAENDGIENTLLDSGTFHMLAEKAARRMCDGDESEPMSAEQFGISVQDISTLACQMYMAQARMHGLGVFIRPSMMVEFIAKIFLHGVIFARMEMERDV